MSDSRVDEFREEIDALKLKTAGDRDQLLQGIGLGLMVAGLVVAIVAYVIASGQNSGDLAIDNLEHNEHTILAIAGLTGSVVGAAIFLRYSFGRFLRFWLLRQIYETQRPTE